MSIWVISSFCLLRIKLNYVPVHDFGALMHLFLLSILSRSRITGSQLVHV